jgi:hypothetical protein
VSPSFDDERNAVRIADFPEAGAFAGRYGERYGWSVPSSSGVSPVIGAGVGGSSQQDFAVSVYFEDTDEQVWFAPHLVEGVQNPGDA